MTKSPQKKPKIGEKDIQRTILDWLTSQKIFHYRQNSGAFKDKKNHLYRFGTSGAPDIVCVIDGRYVGVEVKAKTGIQSDSQIAFQAKLEKGGGKYILAHSLEELKEKLYN